MRTLIRLFDIQHNQIGWSFFVRKPSNCDINTFVPWHARIEFLEERARGVIVFVITSRPHHAARMFTCFLISRLCRY